MTVRAQPAAREGVHSRDERLPVECAHSYKLSDGFPQALPGRMAEALTGGAGVLVAFNGLSVAFNGLKNREAMQTLSIASDETDASGAHPVRRVRLLGDDGLQLTVTYTFHLQHNAIVIGGALENVGAQPIRGVKELRSFDLAFGCTVTGCTVTGCTVTGCTVTGCTVTGCTVTGCTDLHTIGGGTTHFVFAPFAFQQNKRRFMGSLWAPVRIDSGDTGRSSDNEMPFFCLEADDGPSGIYGGLEWSGLWHLEFHRRYAFFFIRGGIEEIDITLRPGEKLEMPRALLGFYQGPIHDGRNALRRFIRDWFPRHWDGWQYHDPQSGEGLVMAFRITGRTNRKRSVCAA